jgi:hypothetical protein
MRHRVPAPDTDPVPTRRGGESPLGRDEYLQPLSRRACGSLQWPVILWALRGGLRCIASVADCTRRQPAQMICRGADQGTCGCQRVANLRYRDAENWRSNWRSELSGRFSSSGWMGGNIAWLAEPAIVEGLHASSHARARNTGVKLSDGAARELDRVHIPCPPATRHRRAPVLRRCSTRPAAWTRRR